MAEQIIPVPSAPGAGPDVPSEPYGLRITDNSMVPRVCRGELVFVDPRTPIERGHDVLLTLADGRRTVRRFLQRRNGVLKFGGYGRACRDLTLRESDVTAVHHVYAIVSPTQGVRS